MLHNTAAKHGAKYLGSTPCNGIKCGITTAVIFAAAANPVRVHKRHGQYFAECNNGDGRKRYPFGFRKNIDDDKARMEFPLHNRFMCEGVDVWMTHIGGYPGKYNPNIKAEMTANPPKLFICGHSHILKVIFDKKHNLLHMNPGAAGKSGFHQVRTMLRFVIDGDKIKDLEIIEIGKK